MSDKKLFFIQRVLKKELDSRLKKNPRYSLRAFARFLEMAPSKLSEIINGKAGLSLKSAQKIAYKLNLSEDEKNTFCDSAELQFARKAIDREKARYRLTRKSASVKYQKVSLDTFESIYEWYCFAILELVETTQFKNDSTWIAKQLGITNAESTSALERLKKAGLLVEENGSLKTDFSMRTTTTNIPSEAIRKFHHQILQKAVKNLKAENIDNRDYSTALISIDKSQLKMVKNRILKFRKSLLRELSKSTPKDEVFCLSIQFFSILEIED